jgi:bisphosphoglycerate-independent phosphoglycerate mutase (AlkP superfamily)
LITRLKAISDTDLYNASSSDSIQIYNSYPETSKFELSDTFKQQIESMHENLFWGVIKNIDTSNTARVAGFLADSIFYITFLDKDHLFFR